MASAFSKRVISSATTTATATDKTAIAQWEIVEEFDNR